MIDITLVQIGSLIEFKKPHPCGGKIWKVLRIGIDFKKRIKKIVEEK